MGPPFTLQSDADRFAAGAHKSPDTIQKHTLLPLPIVLAIFVTGLGATFRRFYYDIVFVVNQHGRCSKNVLTLLLVSSPSNHHCHTTTIRAECPLARIAAKVL